MKRNWTVTLRGQSFTMGGTEAMSSLHVVRSIFGEGEVS